MDKGRIRNYLADFQERGFTNVIKRDTSLKPSKKIQTVVGARRVGKTFLLFNKIKELEQSGVPRKQIIYLNFESPALNEITFKEIKDILEIHWSMHPGVIKKETFMFIDEPQSIKKWELAVRELSEEYSVKIFITGSSSKLLSREIATSLRGQGNNNLPASAFLQGVS
ncbi:MAG: AAA family ATPase [Candidatus Woesearchaeota archaeon]